MVSPAPGWYADPYQRHENRYWNGQAWSEHVSDHGQAFVDPPGGMTQQAASSPLPSPMAGATLGPSAAPVPAPTYAAAPMAPAAISQRAARRGVTPKLLVAGVAVVAIVAGGVGSFSIALAAQSL